MWSKEVVAMFRRGLGFSLASLAVLMATIPRDALAGGYAKPNIVSRLTTELGSQRTRAQIGQLLRHRWKIKKISTNQYRPPRWKQAVDGIKGTWSALHAKVGPDEHLVNRPVLSAVMRWVAARDLRVLKANHKTLGVHHESRWSPRNVSAWAILDTFAALGAKPNRALKKFYLRQMEKRLTQAET